MTPLRIAYVPAALRPGGAERQMLALAERLPRDRFEIDFLVLSGSADYDERALAVGATIRYVGSAPPPNSGLLRRMSRRATKTGEFVRTAKAGQYDIIDAWLYPSDVLAALTKVVTRIPIVISGQRNLDPHEQFGLAGRTVDALAMRLTDAVVANSAAAAEYAIGHERVDRAKVRIIRNGVEPIPVADPAARAARRSEMGLQDDDLVIGCVANYLPVKRHDLLIEVFSRVAEQVPTARLVLVGEGPMRPEMEARIAALGLGARVHLHGSVLDPVPLWSAFDIVVQASRSEGLPNALLEAASAGRPIVATAAGGSGEIVIDGETGLLVAIDDADALGGALIRLLTDPPLRARLGAAARDRTLTTFGMDRFVGEFAALYEELAGVRRLIR